MATGVIPLLKMSACHRSGRQVSPFDVKDTTMYSRVLRAELLGSPYSYLLENTAPKVILLLEIECGLESHRRSALPTMLYSLLNAFIKTWPPEYRKGY